MPPEYRYQLILNPATKLPKETMATAGAFTNGRYTVVMSLRQEVAATAYEEIETLDALQLMGIAVRDNKDKEKRETDRQGERWPMCARLIASC